MPERKMTSEVESATLTVKESAKVLGIGYQTAYELVKQGKLPGALHLGRRIVVSRKILHAFLDGYVDGTGIGSSKGNS